LNPSQDKDLDGLYFIDIPWVFSHQVGHRSWPEPWNTYSRLYALGYDSYSLTQEWSLLQSMPQSGLSKHTGVLYVQPNGHIRRELILGQIRQGVARELGRTWINITR
jgi:outer membrane PBP1 activator LpoA protein